MSTNLLLEATGITKTFPGIESSIPVLNGVDFSIGEGESVSIRGESGCGKSTLLNILSGLERADAGNLNWSGRAVGNASLSTLAQLRAPFMGFVFQAYYLAPELNALENVLLGARIAGRLNRERIKRAKNLLEQVGMGARLHHNATKLSGGERQRVAVARALINDPPLILADEPTGNLDESTGDSVMHLLLELVAHEKKSLILVTHNPEYAARTDRECTLHLGSFEARP
jgi:ABC-type lipoprotein export system ATPase subunit